MLLVAGLRWWVTGDGGLLRVIGHRLLLRIVGGRLLARGGI